MGRREEADWGSSASSDWRYADWGSSRSTSAESLEDDLLGYRKYIVYLLPNGVSHWEDVKETVQCELGRDESWLYPVHCSLTGFFSGAVRDREAIMEAAKAATAWFDSKECVSLSLGGAMVTEDNGVIMPLADGEGLADLSSLFTDTWIELFMDHLAPSKLNGVIKRKISAHLTFVNNRHRAQQVTFQDAKRAAVQINNHTTTTAALTWDLVVYELLYSGDVVGGQPHNFSEVARAHEVAKSSVVPSL